jgi:tight adherence protein B
MTYKVLAKSLLYGGGISAVVAYLFYDSAWALLAFPVFVVFLYRREIRIERLRQKDELAGQFLDALRVVSTALLAGLSMENAWKEAQKEIGHLYGESSPMYRELQMLNQSVALSVPLEQQLEEFARRSGVEDISSFSEIFSFAKRSGGDFVAIIGTTTEHMRKKRDTENEIEILITARKTEQKVMNVIPILILAYLRVSSDGYLDVLYKNPVGILFMSLCLAAYGVAIYAAERIMAIRV